MFKTRMVSGEEFSNNGLVHVVFVYCYVSEVQR